MTVPRTRSVPVFLLGLLPSFACAPFLAGSSASALAVSPTPVTSDLGTRAHGERVLESRYCADCHPAIYAEHEQNTHGRAFFDREARLATRGFRRDDCIRCHTPRPVFETGIGMTPMQRWTDLEEGNTCMSCHGRAGVDYASFVGGADCKTAFDPDVGTVSSCATCHRIAGTPDQWSRAEHGKLAGRVCIDCHMPLVERPVAVGTAPRLVRSHTFPASSNEAQLRRAYAYDAQVTGNEVVVRITNKGVGHNFPTANRQRGVESLVVVRDRAGSERAVVVQREGDRALAPRLSLSVRVGARAAPAHAPARLADPLGQDDGASRAAHDRGRNRRVPSVLQALPAERRR